MPTYVNHNHYGALLSSVLDRIKSAAEEVEKDPGVHIGHISVYHNGHMIVLSGFRGYKDNLSTLYRPSNEIWVYDQIVEKWIKKICTGETCKEDIPQERSGATGTVINNNLYMFGGYSEEGNLNTLHRLNLRNLQWNYLKPSGNVPLPCDKVVSWEYDGKLYLFAGYGRGPDPAQWRENIGYNFILDTSSHWHYLRGWNNQFVCYDPVSNSWQWPQCTGTIPVARAAHAAAKIGKHVYVFGGRNGRMRMNDMYMLDMDTFEWTTIMSNEENHPVKGRSWHSLTPVSDHVLVLYGGFSVDNHPLNDCWLFNTHHHTWQQVNLVCAPPRLWHSACLSSFGEILICGGAIANIVINVCREHSKENIFAKDMFSIQFQPKSLLRLCLGAASKDELPLRPLWNELPFSLQSILHQRCIIASLNQDK